MDFIAYLQVFKTLLSPSGPPGKALSLQHHLSLQQRFLLYWRAVGRPSPKWLREEDLDGFLSSSSVFILGTPFTFLPRQKGFFVPQKALVGVFVVVFFFVFSAQKILFTKFRICEENIFLTLMLCVNRKVRIIYCFCYRKGVATFFPCQMKQRIN